MKLQVKVKQILLSSEQKNLLSVKLVTSLSVQYFYYKCIPEGNMTVQLPAHFRSRGKVKDRKILLKIRYVCYISIDFHIIVVKDYHKKIGLRGI